jgi:ribosomal peptide maturation radical SAM protein 1
MNSSPRTLLVSMPWAVIYLPSIQLGTLEAVLRGAGVPVTSRSYYLDFVECTTKEQPAGSLSERVTVDNHIEISESSWLNGVGDWIFCVPPLRDLTENDVRDYLAYLESLGIPESTIEVALALKRAVPQFIERCVEDVLAWDPDVVGFTSTFSQNAASLALALALKTRRPDLKIVFGGANCDDTMGKELLRSFSFVDYIVQGEAEYALPELIAQIGRGVAEPSVGGLLYRSPEGEVVANPAGTAVRMDDVPLPLYDEYFARLATSHLRTALAGRITIPVETARGCWWGAKHHCTFCGLNGSNMTFRSKSPAKAANEFAVLSEKHQFTAFQTVDNILDLGYFKTLLPALAEARAKGDDYHIFYETKANLKKDQIKAMSDAGIYWIQPGIESLSSHVLKLMDKGSTALQNIRLLKWSREYRIAVSWNILWGFPGETEEDYARVIDLLPSLTHLEAPGITRLLLERFSPYHGNPEKWGIRIKGPARWYRHVYDLPEEALMRLAYDFEYDVPELTGRKYAIDIARFLARSWQKQHRNTFRYSRGPGFIRLRDRRPGLPHSDVTLRGVSAALYLACDAGATLAELTRLVDDTMNAAAPADQIKDLLDDLVRRRYMYEEDGKYLALAVADRPLVSYEATASSHLRTREAVLA